MVVAVEPVPLAVVSLEVEPVAEPVAEVEPLAVAPGAVAVPLAVASGVEAEPVAIDPSEAVEPVADVSEVEPGVAVLAVPEAVVSVEAGWPCPGWLVWAVAAGVSPLVWALAVRSDFELVAQAIPRTNGSTSAILRIFIRHSSLWCANCAG